jgi:hypothetical protein
MNAKVSQKNSNIKKWSKKFFTKPPMDVHSG